MDDEIKEADRKLQLLGYYARSSMRKVHPGFRRIKEAVQKAAVEQAAIEIGKPKLELPPESKIAPAPSDSDTPKPAPTKYKRKPKAS